MIKVNQKGKGDVKKVAQCTEQSITSAVSVNDATCHIDKTNSVIKAAKGC